MTGQRGARMGEATGCDWATAGKKARHSHAGQHMDRKLQRGVGQCCGGFQRWAEQLSDLKSGFEHAGKTSGQVLMRLGSSTE